MGVDYLKKLYLGQDMKYGKDDRTLGDWLAHGTYPIAFALPPDARAELQAAGQKVAPLKIDSQLLRRQQRQQYVSQIKPALGL